MPMLSQRPNFLATRSLVPTPSVVDRSMGSFQPLRSRGTPPAKPPMALDTALEGRSRMKSAKASPAAMSTPAFL